jgi:hypothetical protein
LVRVGPITALTDVQWLCLGMAAAALAGMATLRRRFPVRPVPPPAVPRPPVEAAAR